MCCANARQAGKFEIFRSRRRGEKTSKNKEMGYIPQGMEIEALSLSLRGGQEAAKKQSDITGFQNQPATEIALVFLPSSVC